MLTTLLMLLIAGAPAKAPQKDLAQTAVDAGQFKTLVAAVQRAGLLPALTGKDQLTVFAPTDAAFAKLPKGTVEELLKPENRDQLTSILALHVVPGRVDALTALRARNAKTLGGETISIRLLDGRVKVNEANVVKTDIFAKNGVIHVIDRVLIPAPKRNADPVLATLELAIDRGVPLFNAGQKQACADVYEIAVRAVLDLGGDKLSARDRRTLARAIARLPKDHSDRAWALRGAMDKVFERAAHSKRTMKAKAKAKSTFKPRIEAPLPAGFPAPGPVGEVVVKRYPEYRAARADGRNSFWTLFNHIKKNKIDMTAPVEMTVSDDLVTKDMAFLYEKPDMGKAGQDGRVEVIDQKKVTVLSFGIRGPMSGDKTEAAKRAIERELKERGLTRKGDWRLLGYNSPMVPPAQRFWELQLPVAPSSNS